MPLYLQSFCIQRTEMSKCQHDTMLDLADVRTFRSEAGIMHAANQPLSRMPRRGGLADFTLQKPCVSSRHWNAPRHENTKARQMAHHAFICASAMLQMLQCPGTLEHMSSLSIIQVLFLHFQIMPSYAGSQCRAAVKDMDIPRTWPARRGIRDHPGTSFPYMRMYDFMLEFSCAI